MTVCERCGNVRFSPRECAHCVKRQVNRLIRFRFRMLHLVPVLPLPLHITAKIAAMAECERLSFVWRKHFFPITL